MYSALRKRIQAMRTSMNDLISITGIQTSSQLFVIPNHLCHRLANLAEIKKTDRILIPCAGTGTIL